jgi:capsid protein
MDTPSGIELVDGIELDRHGNPVRYHFLTSHPGAGYTGRSASYAEGIWVGPSSVIHIFNEDRPGQHRGIPEITPALPLFAILRRYSLSTVAAAETAADLAAVLKTDSPSYSVDDIQNVEAGVSFPIRRRTIMSLPFGWSIQQLKAEQPATTYKEFRDAVLTEIARCLNMPKNIAAGDSSDYNYASGRLDHQTYFRAIDIERQEFIEKVVERTFQMWLREFLSIKSGVTQRDIDLTMYPHRWYWDPRPHVDPEKAAKAVEILWDKGLLTDDDYLMEAGVDPEEHYEKLEAMIERRKPLMLPLPGLAMQSIMTDESGGKMPAFGNNSAADRARDRAQASDESPEDTPEEEPDDASTETA